MNGASTAERLAELESKIETLELMVDETFQKKVEKGLEDEREGRVMSLEEYEDRKE